MKRVLFLFVALLSMIATYAADSPKISVDNITHNFGTINEGVGPVNHDFVITNTGNAPLIIISATASCGCTTPDIPRQPIKPGESAKLHVTFDPIGRPGEFDKIIKVKTNIKGDRTTLRIKGTVIPANRQ